MRLIPDPFERRNAERTSRPNTMCGMYIGLCDTEDIFRQMAVAEIRRGKMHKLRRHRLVQYAAMLNISATDAGRLLGEARDIVQEMYDNAQQQEPVFRLVCEEKAEDKVEFPLWVKLSLVLAFLSLVYAIFIR